jgi:hypothetical protein
MTNREAIFAAKQANAIADLFLLSPATGRKMMIKSPLNTDGESSVFTVGNESESYGVSIRVTELDLNRN